MQNCLHWNFGSVSSCIDLVALVLCISNLKHMIARPEAANWLSYGVSTPIERVYSHCTNPISLPVLPPIRSIVLLTPWAAPLIAGPADDVTFDNPSEAFDCVLRAVSLVAEAALEAASWVEAYLRVACLLMSRVCRSIIRGVAANDMAKKQQRSVVHQASGSMKFESCARY